MLSLFPDRPKVTFYQRAERQLKGAVEAIRASVSDGLRRDIDALRAEFDARLAALQPSFGESDEAIERAAKELTVAAAEEADQAATRARHEAEQSAEVQLETAQAAARSLLEQARADQDALQRTIEALQTQMKAADSRAQSDVHAVRAELTAAVAEAQKAQKTIDALQSQMHEAVESAQVQMQTVRSELTAALEDAHQKHATLSSSLLAAQEEAAAARQTIHDRDACVEAAERRLETLGASHARVQQALAAAESQLMSESRDRAALAASLEVAQRGAEDARREAETYRADLREATARLETLRQQGTAQRLDEAPLGRLRRSLGALAGPTSTRALVDTFLRELGRAFGRVALFAMRENRLVGWHSVGFEPTTDVSNLIIPLTIDSPLARAASERTPIVVTGDADEPTTGLLGHETCGAIALPIVIEDRLVAVAYAELARHLAAESRLIELQMAEILAEHFMLSLNRMRSTSAVPPAGSNAPALDARVPATTSRPAPMISPTSHAGPSRAAKRVRMSETVEVVVDGATARLVDISNLGAQVVCVKAIRPNHQVRMVLPQEGQNSPCRVQVVWALFEIASDGAAHYRAGLKFIDHDRHAVEAFLSQRSTNAQRTPA